MSMDRWNWIWIATLALLMSLGMVTAGCPSNDDDDDSADDDDAADDDAADDDSGDDDTGAGCGPIDLCLRSIDGCGAEMTLEDCTAWYDSPVNCADMQGYIDCNCECLAEETCQGYFDCGTVCFNELCT